MTVDLAVDDHVATITLDRPPLNTYTVGLKDDLVGALDVAEADDAVRAIIVTGRGKAFCAGMDLSPGPRAFARLDEPERARTRDSGGELALRFYACAKPLIAAVNGPAMGVGVTMTLPMDLRLASTRARFGFVFAQRGIVMESCSSWFLPRLVGMAKAAEWVTTSRVLTAEEALAGGLVTSVHEPDDLLPAARAVAAGIARDAAPVSVALNRMLMWRMLGEPHPMAANVAESRAMLLRGESPDSTEGVASLLERRQAEFAQTVPRDLPAIPMGPADPAFTAGPPAC
ncbi:enoyl-CoA hydratase-related protein [Actinokineospora pegani]|uniref:enoyl-CoA hydratase-related protein n=1 Tax=Actinokineospora pegani TaxID=2654637 RepID=UPI0012EAE64B|nr:enoyl-CoA hydratase-related protein [Actinokineospora pegani]